MKIAIGLIVLLLGLLFTACQSNTENPFADLTYGDIMKAVFDQSEGTHLEWHGEALDISAADAITFQEAEPCGTNDCGKIIWVKNSADKPVEAIIQSSFDIPDFPPYVAIKIETPPQGAAILGCSYLCLGKTKVQFSPKVAGATYVQN